MITCEPEFRLPLTREDVQFLCRIAEHHHDLSFKFSARNGFLRGWSNFLGDVARPGSSVPATWAEIVLILKLLEIRSGGFSDAADLERANRLHKDLQIAVDRWQFVRPQATTIDTEMPLA